MSINPDVHRHTGRFGRAQGASEVTLPKSAWPTTHGTYRKPALSMRGVRASLVALMAIALLESDRQTVLASPKAGDRRRLRRDVGHLMPGGPGSLRVQACAHPRPVRRTCFARCRCTAPPAWRERPRRGTAQMSERARDIIAASADWLHESPSRIPSRRCLPS
jgi:hypothetical protein